jgi:1-acyl-sn-glycerol-3-phosphate acyltransferase
VGYHRVVCFILGIKVQVHGKLSEVTPTLFVSNHVSYLDIEVMGGLMPISFVAKAEVATWPFFSTLAKAQRTIFIERTSGKTSASREAMMKRLDTGDNLMLFPEGTSSDGTRVLPFRSALFGVAQLRRNDKPIVVQPVSISYTRLDGIPLGRYWRPLFAWFGDLDLVPHLWQMVCLGETEAVVTFHPPIDIDQLGDRKKLAEYCFRQVSSGVQAANSGRLELLPPPAKVPAASVKAAV